MFVHTVYKYPLWNVEPMELPVHSFSHASMTGQSKNEPS